MSRLLIILLFLCICHLPAAAAATSVNSFTVEFTPDGKMNITTSITVDEEKLSNLLFRIGAADKSPAEAESMFEDSLRKSFDAEKLAWRKFEGYPRNQAGLFDIENYKVEGYRNNGFYNLKYRLELRSRQAMRIIDPTFVWENSDCGVLVSIMLHFPFPDIPLTKGISLWELSPDAMQYMIILPYPISNSRAELADIPGFLSSTAYCASFLVRKGEYTSVILAGNISQQALPSARDWIEIEVRDDHSATVTAEVQLGKADLRRICSDIPDTDMLDALGIIRDEYDEVVRSLLPPCISADYSIDTGETSSDLIFSVHADIPDLIEANLCKGLFEFSRVGDITLIYLPVYNPFDPVNLNFCQGYSLRPTACNFAVIMPGRINNVNKLRSTGLLFKAEGNRIDFHLANSDYSFLTISSDSGSVY